MKGIVIDPANPRPGMKKAGWGKGSAKRAAPIPWLSDVNTKLGLRCEIFVQPGAGDIGYMFEVQVDGNTIASGHRDTQEQAEREAKRNLSIYESMVEKKTKRKKK